MDVFLLQVLNGLLLGSVYSLVALGLTLVYGIFSIPNFAHGGLYMIGAFIAFLLVTHFGLGYWTALLAAALGVGLCSVAAERLVFRPLRNAPELAPMMAAIGLMMFLESSAQVVWGTDFHRMAAPWPGIVEWGGLVVPIHRLLVIAVAFALVLALQLFLRLTTTGSAILAVAQNPDGASLVGISTRKIGMLVFALSGVLAAVAAVLYAPLNLVYPAMGQLVIVKAFVIVVLGGMGSITGAVVGALIIGLAESFGAFYVSPDYKDLIAFALLVVVLSLRPNGLFAKEARTS